MTRASGSRTVEAGRSGLSPSPTTPASGFRPVEAGDSGWLPRVVWTLSMGAENRLAMCTARSGDAVGQAKLDRAVASSYGLGRIAQ